MLGRHATNYKPNHRSLPFLQRISISITFNHQLLSPLLSTHRLSTNLNRICTIWFFLSGFFHLAQCFQGWFMVSHVSVFRPFLWLIVHCTAVSTLYFPSPQSLNNAAMNNFIQCGHRFLLFLGMRLDRELLGNIVKWLFSKVQKPSTPISSVWGSYFLPFVLTLIIDIILFEAILMGGSHEVVYVIIFKNCILIIEVRVMCWFSYSRLTASLPMCPHSTVLFLFRKPHTPFVREALTV